MPYLGHEADIISLFRSSEGKIFSRTQFLAEFWEGGKSASTLAASLILTIITSLMKDDVLQVPSYSLIDQKMYASMKCHVGNSFIWQHLKNSKCGGNVKNDRSCFYLPLPCFRLEAEE